MEGDERTVTMKAFAEMTGVKYMEVWRSVKEAGLVPINRERQFAFDRMEFDGKEMAEAVRRRSKRRAKELRERFDAEMELIRENAKRAEEVLEE